MIIKLSPQRRDDLLVVSRAGDVLTINGVTYDFSGLLEGETLPGEAVETEFVSGDVEREGGKLHLTLLLPNGPDATEAQRFPEDIVDPPDGDIEFPPGPVEEEPEVSP